MRRTEIIRRLWGDKLTEESTLSGHLLHPFLGGHRSMSPPVLPHSPTSAREAPRTNRGASKDGETAQSTVTLRSGCTPLVGIGEDVRMSSKMRTRLATRRRASAAARPTQSKLTRALYGGYTAEARSGSAIPYHSLTAGTTVFPLTLLTRPRDCPGLWISGQSSVAFERKGGTYAAPSLAPADNRGHVQGVRAQKWCV